MVAPVIKQGTGKHTISLMLQGPDDAEWLTHFGVVRDGVPCDQYPVEREDGTTSWFMCSFNGGLWGNGKAGSDEAGDINPGQVLTMQVDLDAGILKFWVDGKRHGPGWTSGVTGPLRWAVNVFSDPGVDYVPELAIVPDPVLE